jgi:plastocyanin
LGILVMTLASQACTGEETQPPSTATPSPEPTVEPAEPPSETGGITVDLTNFAYVPDEIVAAPGSTLTLRNGNPATPHTFTIEGSIDVAVDPQTIETITLDLGPGTYDVACQFHGGQGMVATLTVESI